VLTERTEGRIRERAQAAESPSANHCRNRSKSFR
jgi:hypothetical protein